MIVFASPITDVALYRRAAEPGIRRAAEPDSEIIANNASGSIARSYNLILDTLAERDERSGDERDARGRVEALVLLHQDAEIVSTELCATVRATLRDPDVGVIGCVGAVGVRSLAWWEGSVTWASFAHRYEELGGGEVPALSWTNEELPALAQTGEVDSLDGFVLVLAPWTIRNVRFDESLGQLHGYDFDFCQQVRAAGRKVVTADFKVVHHHSLELVSNPESWIAAHIRLTEKWDGRLPGSSRPDGDWRRRALRAEAEASLARTQAVAAMMHADARNRQLQREVDEMRESVGWRLTEPLRRVNALRRGLRRSPR